MSSIEDLNNGLTDVSKQLVDTTGQYQVTAEFLLSAQVEVAVEQITVSGRQIAAVLEDMPDGWRGPMATVNETAEDCTNKVTELAVEPDIGPNERIAAALAGLATMAEGAQGCDAASLRMREKMQSAMGHLIGFAKDMLDAEILAQQATEEARKSYEGNAAAQEHIMEYVLSN